MLHDVEELDGPEQSFPPNWGPSLVRDRTLVPELHVFVQDPHGPQGFHLQSTEKQGGNPYNGPLATTVRRKMDSEQQKLETRA